MIRPPPISTRTAPRFPYTTLILAAVPPHPFARPRQVGGRSQNRRGARRQRGLRGARTVHADPVERLPLRGRGTGHQHPSLLPARLHRGRSEEHTSELQSLMRISYAVFCLKKNNTQRKLHNQL